MLEGIGGVPRLRLAQGNIALALYKLQRYDDATKIFEELLPQYEQDGNLLEVVRTLEHLAEMRCNSGDVRLAMLWAERLKVAAHTLVQTQGTISDLTVASLGMYANVLIAAATPDIADNVRRQMLTDAIKTLESVRKMSVFVRSPMTALIARAQVAKAAWGLDDLAQEDIAFQKVISEAAMGLGKSLPILALTVR
jgi:hypothetical protein